MPGDRNALNAALVTILRRTTSTVRLFPFLYAPVYIASMFGYLLFTESAAIVLDTLFYLSFLTVALLVRLSYCLRLCVWHRIQCCLPLLPQPLIFIDNYIYRFGETIVIINLWLAILIFTMSLVNAYHTFINPHNSRIEQQ